MLLAMLLLIQGAIDYKYKEIPFVISALGCVIGIGICVFDERPYDSIAVALIPGLLVLLFAKISREAIGYGDGIILVVMGIYLEAELVWSILIFAILIAGVFALTLLVVFRKDKKYPIPFVPFLAIAYVLTLLEIGGSFV